MLYKLLKWYKVPGRESDPKTGKEVIFLEEGNVELHLCHVKCRKSKIFCSDQGRFYHLRNGQLSEIKPTGYNPNGHFTYSGGRVFYLSVRQCTPHKTCHALVYEAWIGKRHTNMQIDHINGVPTDNRACNLQEVTPAENRKRAVILRARRMIARQDNDLSKDPKNMKPEELLELFNAYNVAGDVYEGE